MMQSGLFVNITYEKYQESIYECEVHEFINLLKSLELVPGQREFEKMR